MQSGTVPRCVSCWLLFALITLLQFLSNGVSGLTVHRPTYLAQRGIKSQSVSFGPPDFNGGNYRGKVLVVDKGVLCQKNAKDGSWVGSVLITDGSDCAFGVQALRAQSAGAVGLIVAREEGGSDVGAEVNIMVERISDADYDSIVLAIKNGNAVEVTLGVPINVLRYKS
ncbi:PA domain [Trypanosoma vivax]|uniref:PA domain-containing protein n=1 Tax=Trypanosoma vivax (strain Y486) TaxID=1055687 RepID=G0UBQ3_TRYVY|nr:hypothetical protein TRVL_04268 [Trypanosoma vivax]KAH8609463.1 PA domain [Trypanosoma vivax]CCC53251.1 conserved hypothetical protein [Trypanosoma vivax Y486]